MLLGFLSVELDAQDQYYVGGSLSLNPVEDEFTSNDVVNINTIWGYRFETNLDLGLVVFTSYQNRVVGFNDTGTEVFRDKSLVFGFSPFVRLKKEVNRRFTLFNQAGFSVSRTRIATGIEPLFGVSTFISSSISNRTGLSINLRPGFEFNLSPRWFINAQVTLASYEISINRSSSINTSLIRFGLNASSLNLGVFYRFGKGKEKKKVDNDNL